MKKLYKFYEDFGQMGSLEGIFVEDDKFMHDKIFGGIIYFGEVLGKHSDIFCDITEDNCKVLTDDEKFIDMAIEYGIVPVGHNPVDYYFEEEY